MGMKAEYDFTIASEMLRQALVAEHSKRIALAPKKEATELARDLASEIRSLDDIIFHIESGRPFWQMAALANAILALAGVEP
jgi:hypothetical protein